MKNIILFFSILLLGAFAANSQPAPDFTATDINGNTHTLYDYLNDGKIVILDVSATWCPPCWSLHQNHYLEHLYSTFGPDGTDELVIMFYEGDGSTNTADLNGTGSNTLGDWVTGISYPIFDETDAAALGVINNAYAPQGFPTVNVICPTTKTIIADIYQDDYEDMIAIINGCSSASLSTVSDLYMGRSANAALCLQDEAFGHVINTGTEPFTTFTVEAKDPGGNVVGSGTFTGNLTTGQSADVSIGMVTAPATSSVFTFEVTAANDPNTHNNMEDTEFVGAQMATSSITVSIDADQYVTSDPTYWSIEDGSGNVVVQGPALVPNTLFVDTYTIPASGCHTFVIVDDYGDGNSGAIEVKDSDGTIIFDNSSFGAKGEGKFNVSQSVSNQDFEEISSFNLLSNMVSNQLIVSVENMRQVSKQKLTITNLLGQVWYNQELEPGASDHELTIDVNNLNPGFYFAVLESNGSVTSKKFTKQ